jgi:hypothetical protein
VRYELNVYIRHCIKTSPQCQFSHSKFHITLSRDRTLFSAVGSLGLTVWAWHFSCSEISASENEWSFFLFQIVGPLSYVNDCQISKERCRQHTQQVSLPVGFVLIAVYWVLSPPGAGGTPLSGYSCLLCLPLPVNLLNLVAASTQSVCSDKHWAATVALSQRLTYTADCLCVADWPAGQLLSGWLPRWLPDLLLGWCLAVASLTDLLTIALLRSWIIYWATCIAGCPNNSLICWLASRPVG